MTEDVELADCEHCDGTGQVECYVCGNDMECDECGGTGVIEEDT
jgi:DnaJ-class molecular chaperone